MEEFEAGDILIFLPGKVQFCIINTVLYTMYCVINKYYIAVILF